MKTSGIKAALPAQDLDRAKSFYVERVGRGGRYRSGSDRLT